MHNARDSDSSKSLINSRNKPFMPNHLKNKFRKTIQSNAENEIQNDKKIKAEKKHNKKRKPDKKERALLKNNRIKFKEKNRFRDDKDMWPHKLIPQNVKSKAQNKNFLKQEQPKNTHNPKYISKRVKNKMKSIIEKEGPKRSPVKTDLSYSVEKKEEMLGARVKTSNFDSITSTNSIPLVPKRDRFKKPLNSVNSVWEYVDDDYQSYRDKREHRFQSRHNLQRGRSLDQISRANISSVRTKKNRKWRDHSRKGKAGKDPIDGDRYLPIHNEIDQKTDNIRENLRKSYRTRESILSVDRRLSDDLGKLSHHMRQIFQYLTMKEVIFDLV